VAIANVHNKVSVDTNAHCH